MSSWLRWIASAACAFGFGVVVACATPEPPAPLPAHPFPSWVSELEAGRTGSDAVRARFGSPDEIEQSVRGGMVWRYVFREIDWPDDDPLRPVVAADGSLRSPETSSRLDAFRAGMRRVGGWFDRTFYYPPRQPRAPRTRRLPATVHQLEVVFGRDGTLSGYRYTPARGFARVPSPG